MDFKIKLRCNRNAFVLILAMLTWLPENARAQTANCVTETTFSVTIQPKPTAAFNFMANGLSTTFSNASANASTYAWDFGDPGSGSSNTSSEANPTHDFTAPGNYTVTLLATNGCGSRSITQNIQVTCPTLSVAAAVNGPMAICPGASTLLAATPGYSGYQWILDGNPIANSNIANFSASAPGSYTVIATNTSGCTGVSQGISVGLLPLAQPSFSTTVNGFNASFNNSSVNATSYSWNFGDPNAGASNTSFGVNPTHSFTAPGTYTVTLTATNACGVQTITQEVVVACIPPTVSIASSGSLQFCQGGSAMLQAVITNIAAYQWYLNNVPIPSGTSPLLTVTTAGEYKVFVTDFAGCQNYSDILLVEVYPLPTATVVSSVGEAVCEGASLVLSGGQGVDYQWITPDGSTILGGSIAIPAANISNNGTYSLTVTDGNGCASTTEFDLVVNPLPQVSMSGLNSDYKEDAPPVSITGTPVGGIFSGNGVSGGQFSPSFAGLGLHTIYYTYTDANNCTNQDSVVVNVSPVSSTSLTATIGQIRVFPNPNYGDFWLEMVLSSNKNLTFSLTNALGQTLENRQELLPSGQSILHFGSHKLSGGVYFLKIMDGAQHTCLRVIVTK